MIVVGFLDFSKNQVIRDKGEQAKQCISIKLL